MKSDSTGRNVKTNEPDLLRLQSQPTDSKNRPVESTQYMWGNRVCEVAYMVVKNVQEVHFWH